MGDLDPRSQKGDCVMVLKTDVCVLGAGMGGTGCVYRLLKNGRSVVVIDRNPDFGGTCVFAGVDGFEPGVSLDGMHLLLKDILEQGGNGHVLEDVPNCNLFYPENGMNWENQSFSRYPWGLSVHSELEYEKTMYRRGGKRFQFDADAMTAAIRKVLSPYEEHLTTLFGYSYQGCTVTDGKVTAITATNGSETVTVEASYFVDASGDIVLARDAGCDHTIGTEGADAYGEPSAGEASDTVNAVSYVFRVRPVADKQHIDPLPEGFVPPDGAWVDERMRRCVSCFCLYPNGDINVNMLPTMQGREYMALGTAADAEGHARVRAYWRYLQEEKGMQGYTLVHIFQAGIRETYRLIGKHVLTENDVRAGHSPLPSVAAIADHALDIHGKSGMCKELDNPYAIPLECTMTKEFDNLFVACRGASFSHIAAASVRLNRTILSLGEHVGEHISTLLK